MHAQPLRAGLVPRGAAKFARPGTRGTSLSSLLGVLCMLDLGHNINMGHEGVEAVCGALPALGWVLRRLSLQQA